MANIFPTDFEEKNTIANNDFILFSDSEDWNKLKKAQYSNLKWEQWDAATITVGSVTTWAAWSSASVVNTWTTSAAVLDFTIPQWDKWDTWNPWSAATITVGTTTTWAAGTNASVTNSGTSSAAVLNFTIPKWADGESANTKLFTLSSTSDLTNAQAAYDWYLAGKYPVIKYSSKLYYPYSMGSTNAFWAVPFDKTADSSGTTWLYRDWINMTLSSWTITAMATTTIFVANSNFLRTGVNYGTPYTPEYDWSPSTKKYVDDKSAYVWSSAPADPTEWKLWYDTTNDVLKTYDGIQWNECGSWGGWSGDVVWPASSTNWHLAVFDGTTWKLLKDWWSVPTVPTNISSFNNDSWYLTSATWVTSVNGSTGAVTVTPWIPNETSWTTTTVSGIWAGTEAEYNLISTPSSNIIYFVY